MLPVSLPPLPGEACTSWLARLAARYDLDGTGLNGALGIPYASAHAGGLTAWPKVPGQQFADAGDGVAICEAVEHG
ncbi:hypothetical protein, partial [Roseicella aquatilis]|uniref:hypothetical protein n=1 Tax=Roseicella aquatilis TaxID=2527868 RepID=UPI00197D409F